MKRLLFTFSIILFSITQIQAQDNVAEIAHAFIKAVKENNLKHIQPRYLAMEASYAVLPKESVGMNTREKNNAYIKPMYETFQKNFEQIQEQISAGNINTKKIDLLSYKLEKLKGKTKPKPQAMSLFFNYNKKEHILPISVIQVDERWYILGILPAGNLFE